MDEQFEVAWLEAHRVRLERTVAREEIVGIGHVMTEIESLVGRLRDSAATAALGARPPRGMLFWGRPGVGKTLVARYVAGAIGDVPMYELSADELSPARVRALFAHLADAHARCVLYLDEIDLVGLQRAEGEHSPSTRATLVALLAALDGLREAAGPILIAASNRPPVALDPALLRPGRLGYHLQFGLPSEDERAALLARFLQGRPQASDIDVGALAALAQGETPAALTQLVDDAAGLALARGRARIGQAELLEALGRGGKIVPAIAFDPAAHRLPALHEAGHVAAAVALRGPAWVREVRLEDGGGRTVLGPPEESAAQLPADELRDRLVVYCAGSEAEVLLVGAGSLGGAKDLGRAASLAEQLLGAGLLPGAPGFPPGALDEPSAPARDAVGFAVAGLLAEARLRAARVVAPQGAALRRFADTLLAAGGALEGEALRAAIAAAGLRQGPERTHAEGDPTQAEGGEAAR